jgi:hypothetical protein
VKQTQTKMKKSANQESLTSTVSVSVTLKIIVLVEVTVKTSVTAVPTESRTVTDVAVFVTVFGEGVTVFVVHGIEVTTAGKWWTVWVVVNVLTLGTLVLAYFVKQLMQSEVLILLSIGGGPARIIGKNARRATRAKNIFEKL